MSAPPYFFPRIGDFPLYVDVQLFQYPLGLPHFSSHYVGNDYGIGVNCIGERQPQVFSVDSFCYLAEHAAGHQSAGSG